MSPVLTDREASAPTDQAGFRIRLEWGQDALGAGAIIDAFPSGWSRSPEAEATACTWQAMRGQLRAALEHCSSGRELIERGFVADVAIAAEHDVSTGIPRLVDGAYQARPS